METRTSGLDRIIAGWFAARPRLRWLGTAALRLLLTVVSATWGVASCVKPRDELTRSVVIVCLNLFYLLLALATVAWLTYRLGDDLGSIRARAWSGWWLWAYFLWSRCAEVLIAFYRDAMDQLKGRPPGSDLTGSWRVWLALNSYIELIVDYGLLYCLVPVGMWSTAPNAITETLWISASTITTSGNAGFPPAHWMLQLLSASEIFGGVILLVVCFTLYAGGKADDGSARPGPCNRMAEFPSRAVWPMHRRRAVRPIGLGSTMERSAATPSGGSRQDYIRCALCS